jgi:hypothetical protein
MRDLPWHPSQGPYVADVSTVEAADPGETIDAAPFPGEVADCCIARPLYRVVLPSPFGEPPAAHLLLCGHHFRASTDGLARACAAVFDSADRRVA